MKNSIRYRGAKASVFGDCNFFVINGKFSFQRLVQNRRIGEDNDGDLDHAGCGHGGLHSVALRVGCGQTAPDAWLIQNFVKAIQTSETFWNGTPSEGTRHSNHKNPGKRWRTWRNPNYGNWQNRWPPANIRATDTPLHHLGNNSQVFPADSSQVQA